jgi:hypothetical protein
MDIISSERNEGNLLSFKFFLKVNLLTNLFLIYYDKEMQTLFLSYTRESTILFINLFYLWYNIFDINLPYEIKVINKKRKEKKRKLSTL